MPQTSKAGRQTIVNFGKGQPQKITNLEGGIPDFSLVLERTGFRMTFYVTSCLRGNT